MADDVMTEEEARAAGYAPPNEVQTSTPGQTEPDNSQYMTEDEARAAGYAPAHEISPGETFGRAFAHAVLPTAASIGPMMAGAEAGAAIGTAVAPGIGTVVGGFGGAVLGGAAAGMVAGGIQEKLLDWTGLNDRAEREEGAKQNPKAALLGELAPAAVTFQFGKLADTLASRLVTGGGMAGLDVAQQKLESDQPLDWFRVGANFAAGAAFHKPRAAFEGYAQAGQQWGARAARKVGFEPPPLRAPDDVAPADIAPSNAASDEHQSQVVTQSPSSTSDSLGTAQDKAPPREGNVTEVGQQAVQPTNRDGGGDQYAKKPEPTAPKEGVSMGDQPTADPTLAAVFETENPAAGMPTQAPGQGGENLGNIARNGAPPGSEAPPRPPRADAPDGPVPNWLQANRDLAVQNLKGTPTEQKVIELARQGKTAKEISQVTGLDTDTIRNLRDNAGVEPAGPMGSVFSGEMPRGGEIRPAEKPAGALNEPAAGQGSAPLAKSAIEKSKALDQEKLAAQRAKIETSTPEQIQAYKERIGMVPKAEAPAEPPTTFSIEVPQNAARATPEGKAALAKLKVNHRPSNIVKDAIDLLTAKGETAQIEKLQAMPAGKAKDQAASALYRMHMSQTGDVGATVKTPRARPYEKNREIKGWVNPDTGKPYITVNKERAQLYSKVHEVNKKVFDDPAFKPPEKVETSADQVRERAKAMLDKARELMGHSKGLLPTEIYKMPGMRKPREFALLRLAKQLVAGDLRPDKGAKGETTPPWQKFLANEKLIRGSAEDYATFERQNRMEGDLAFKKTPTSEVEGGTAAETAEAARVASEVRSGASPEELAFETTPGGMDTERAKREAWEDMVEALKKAGRNKPAEQLAKIEPGEKRDKAMIFAAKLLGKGADSVQVGPKQNVSPESKKMISAALRGDVMKPVENGFKEWLQTVDVKDRGKVEATIRRYANENPEMLQDNDWDQVRRLAEWDMAKPRQEGMSRSKLGKPLSVKGTERIIREIDDRLKSQSREISDAIKPTDNPAAEAAAAAETKPIASKAEAEKAAPPSVPGMRPPEVTGEPPATGRIDEFARKAKTAAERFARSIGVSLRRLVGHDIANDVQMIKDLEALPQEVRDLGEKFFFARERNALDTLSPRERQLYDQYAQPLFDQSDALFKYLQQLAPGLVGPEVKNHIMRLSKSIPELQELASKYTSDPIIGRGFASYAMGPAIQRRFYALERADGMRRVIWVNPDGKTITEFNNKKQTEIPAENFKFAEGEKFKHPQDNKEYTMREANVDEIEKHTDVEYFHDAFLSALTARNYLLKMINHTEQMKSWQTNPEMLKYMGEPKNAEDRANMEARGWVTTNLGTYKNWLMHPYLAHVFDDFAQPGINSDPLNSLRNLSQAVTRLMFWMPTAHLMNVGAHWFTARGWDWIKPSGWKNLAADFADAFKGSTTMDDFQMQLIKAGAPIMAPRIFAEQRMQTAAKIVGETMRKNEPKWDPIAKTLGMGVGELADRIYEGSSKIMWTGNDILYRVLVREQMRKGLNMHDAIIEAARHFPSYNTPAEMIFATNGGRHFAQIMREPTLLVFGPYHYGMMNAWAHMVKDIAQGTGEERKQAIGQLMAVGVLGFMVKPILDKAAQYVTGNESAEQRPRGPLSLPTNIVRALKGTESPTQFAQNTLTTAPLATTAWQMLKNTDNLGKPIISPGKMQALGEGDVLAGVGAAIEAADFAARAASPWNTIENAYHRKANPFMALTEQALDWRNPSDASKKYEAKSTKRNIELERSRIRKPTSIPSELWNNVAGPRFP